MIKVHFISSIFVCKVMTRLVLTNSLTESFFSHACKFLGGDSNEQPILGLLEIYCSYHLSYEDFPFVPYFFKPREHSDHWNLS